LCQICWPCCGSRAASGAGYSHGGKVAALYAQHLSDPVALNAVDQIESLTTGFSRKVWQKVMLLERAAAT